jgi:hypothetical protein
MSLLEIGAFDFTILGIGELGGIERSSSKRIRIWMFIFINLEK